MDDNIVVDSSLEKLIDDQHQPIYLVWALNDQGLVSLRAICTTRAYATAYRDSVKFHRGIVRTWIENTITNHLYGEGFVEKNYPKMVPWNLDERGNIESCYEQR